MSRATKARLRKLEQARPELQPVMKVWDGTGPEPALEPGDPRPLVLVDTGIRRSEAFEVGEGE